MPIQRALLAAALVLSLPALAGCAGDRQAQRSGGARTVLPRTLARQLAAESDDIARKLASGDACAARGAAIRLHQQTIRAINAGHVPAVFQNALRSTATDLASRIRCVVQTRPTPRAAPAPPPVKPAHENRGKHKGRGKHKDKGD
jgi:hypothetical protein